MSWGQIGHTVFWVSVVMVAYVIFFLAYARIYLLWRDWKYPGHDRPLSNQKLSFIEQSKVSFESYANAKSYQNSLSWPFFILFLLGWIVLAGVIGFFVINGISAAETTLTSSKPEFGDFIGNEIRTLWILLTVFPGIFGFVAIVTSVTYFLFLRRYKFTDWFVIIQQNTHEKFPGKVLRRAAQIENLVRIDQIKTNEKFDPSYFLWRIGRNHAFGFLKAGLFLSLFGVMASWGSFVTSSGFYQNGIVFRSFSTKVVEFIPYADSEKVGIGCLFDPKEKEFSELDYHFYYDGQKVGKLRLWELEPEKFIAIDKNLRLANVPFFDERYYFKHVQNADHPYKFCVSKLIERNPEAKDLWTQLMHFDELSESPQ